MAAICAANHDAWATAAVLDGMLDRYPDMPRDVTGIYLDFLDADIGRWFTQGPRGESLFARGKHRAANVLDVARAAPSYLRWLRGQALLADARSVIDDALRHARE